jgi:phospholipid/cholesterol/gamma-HCH transport system substrate-binding protein
VGEVSKITFDSNLESKEVLVEMKLMSEFQPRIRRDSEARIDTVGVLGDKYVSLSMGDPKKDVLADGEWINARASLDVLEYMKKATDILNSTSSIAHKVDRMLGEDSEASKASLARSFSHLESLLQATKEGDGLLHALVYDPSMTTKVQATLGNLQVMSSDLRDATGAVRHGDGMAHELIYGEDGKRLAKDLADLSEALSALARDIRNEESVVHSLIYDKDKAQMVADLAAAAESLKRTSESIEKGDGTVGLMVRDPALYEDLRALVGGAQRNKLLRAYIRRTVEEGEQSNSSPWQPPEE